MAIKAWMGTEPMIDLGGMGDWGARAFDPLLVMDASYFGLSVIIWVVLLLVSAVVVGLLAITLRKRRKKMLVLKLQKQRKAMEKASSELFSQRGADEIQEAVNAPGKPQTVISEGAVAYTEAGEMLVFKSSDAIGEGDVVASAVDAFSSRAGAQGVPTWSPTYNIEKIIALHITGVVMFAVDAKGKIIDGRDLDNELLMALEKLLEEARWLGGEMVRTTYKDRTVSLTWGEGLHLAAIVEGEPDERLDRELRWALGDLTEEFTDDIWSWGEETDRSVPRTLTHRLLSVFNLTRGVKPGLLDAKSEGGGLRVSSTISWRHSLAEYTLGIINNGPGPVRDLELLPTLNKDGKVEVATVYGIDVDNDMRFRLADVEQGKKVVATFAFRVPEPVDVRVDCTLIYRRGVANVQNLKLPGRWIELERREPVGRGEMIEPERALELATQHATFRDRCALYAPHGSNVEALFNAVTEDLSERMDPVVELEDDDNTQMEAWFHGDVIGGGTVIVSITAVPKKGIIDMFATSTEAGVVPGTMVLLRQAVNRAAGQSLSEVLDPELRTTVPRMGVLLFQSWGFFDED